MSSDSRLLQPREPGAARTEVSGRAVPPGEVAAQAEGTVHAKTQQERSPSGLELRGGWGHCRPQQPGSKSALCYWELALGPGVALHRVKLVFMTLASHIRVLV